MRVNLRLNLNSLTRESNFKFYIKTSLLKREIQQAAQIRAVRKGEFQSGGIAVKFDQKMDEISPRYSSVDFCFYVSLR